MKAIPYGRQTITDSDIKAVCDVLQSEYLTQGPAVTEFEKAFASYIGCKYAVAVANGTAALHLSALALNTGIGTKVITTPITFAASANCVLYCGGEVEFADIDPVSYTIDINSVRRILEAHPKGTYAGIIPVDLAGNPVNLEEIKKLAGEYGLWILEDACHAPGGYFTCNHGKKHFCGDGSLAELAIFSFHPVKHIATGEGGMITTNSEELYKRLLLLRTHGITKDPALLIENHGGWYYEMQELGFNYRLSDIQAALGTSQLKRAGEGLARRREIAKRYNSGLTGLPLTLPAAGEGHAYHLYIIRTQRRKELYDFLRLKNIYCQVHYIPVPSLPYYATKGFVVSDYPQALNYYNECLSLPMFPALTNEEQEFVIASIKEFFNK